MGLIGGLILGLFRAILFATAESRNVIVRLGPLTVLSLVVAGVCFWLLVSVELSSDHSSDPSWIVLLSTFGLMWLTGSVASAYLMVRRWAKDRSREQTAHSDALIVRTSPIFSLLVLIFLLAWTAVGFSMILVGDELLIPGLLGSLIFGALVGAWLWGRWWNREIRIDEAGIYDSRLAIPLIPWRDIKSIAIHSMSAARVVRLQLENMETHMNRMNRFDRLMWCPDQWLGICAHVINLSGLSAGEEKVLTAVRRFKPNGVPLAVD